MSKNTVFIPVSLRVRAYFNILNNINTVSYLSIAYCISTVVVRLCCINNFNRFELISRLTLEYLNESLTQHLTICLRRTVTDSGGRDRGGGALDVERGSGGGGHAVQGLGATQHHRLHSVLG